MSRVKLNIELGAWSGGGCSPLCRLALALVALVAWDTVFTFLFDSFVQPSMVSIAKSGLHGVLMVAGAFPILLFLYHTPLAIGIRRHNRILTSVAQLNAKMRGVGEFKHLCDVALGCMVGQTKAQNGAIHFAEEDGGLRLAAGRGLSPDLKQLEYFRPGEGIVGRAAMEKQLMFLADIPHDSLQIDLGTMQVLPSHVLTIPLLHDDQVRGVMTLGYLHSPTRTDIEILDQVSHTIAIALNGIQAARRARKLLEHTQQQAEEMVVNQKVLDETINKLEQTSGYKSRFLASMSHELRSPLNSLLILAKLLFDNKQGNLSDKQVEFAQTIHSAGSELLTLIDEILDLARIEAGQVRIFLDPVKPDIFMDSIEKLFQPTAQNKGLQFQVNLKGMLPVFLYTDQQRVAQILRNLISNAIKFTEKGGVTVVFRSVSSPPGEIGEQEKQTDITGWVAISVEDTGIGIAEQKRDLIFQPFRQVDDRTNRKYGGTGLGLAICRELSGLLGGQVTVESIEGRGSTFTLFLPVCEPPESSADEELKEATKLRPGKLSTNSKDAGLETIRDDRRTLNPDDNCVLVVGTDHEQVRQQNELARTAGLGVVVAGDQGAALFLANYYNPSSLVIVGELPGVDSEAFINRVMKTMDKKSLPVLHLVQLGGRMSSSHSVHGRKTVSLSWSKERIIEESSSYYKKISPKNVASNTPESDTPALVQTPVTEPVTGQFSLANYRILIIEDNMRNVFALTSLLEDNGAEITMGENGRAGLEYLQNNTKPDMVLLDIMMPDMDGYQVLKEIRSNTSMQDLPVIVLTAKAMQGERQRCLDAGASDYLPKPVDPPKLLSMIRIWLESGGET
jgi:signal transduction histidine kinase/CheY-like chemotaxis protein